MEFNVVCVGAGGTGGNFLKEFGRYLSFYHNDNIDISLTIIDGDRIEHKNLERQPFVPEDENSFKATTMASAIIENFNLSESQVRSFPQYIDSVKDLESIVEKVQHKRKKHVTVLVGAVDNHRARQVMHDYFDKVDNIVYIDAANEFYVGEVVTAVRLGSKTIAPPRAFHYPEILKDKGKRASEESCGEINVSAPQHIMTNLFAANLVLSTVIQTIDGKNLGGITLFDSSKQFSRFTPIEGDYTNWRKRRRKNNGC